MTVALKALYQILALPGRFKGNLETRLKKGSCVAAREAVFHPTSRVDNYRMTPQAIVIGAHTHVLGQLLVLAHGGNVHIGQFCFVGEGSRIWSANSINIGDRVLISHGVNIHDHDAHAFSANLRHLHVREILTTGHPNRVDAVATRPIVIEDDAWIGFNATILKGVRIGKGAVVGAASVVTKDVPPFAIVAGNPARIIGKSQP